MIKWNSEPDYRIKAPILQVKLLSIGNNISFHVNSKGVLR